MSVRKTYQYTIFGPTGNYIGLLPNVTSPFSLNQTLNSIGGQLQITVNQSTDVAKLPLSTLTDESGNTITDESGNPIVIDRQPDIVGSSNSNILIANDNSIIVTEISQYHPNGVTVFQGYISKWKIDTSNDTIIITCLMDSQDLGNYLIPGTTQLFADQAQLTEDETVSFASTDTFPSNAQSFVVGAGVTNIAAINVWASKFSGSSTNCTLYLFLGTPSLATGAGLLWQTPLASTSLSIASGSLGLQRFVFASNVPVVPGTKCTFIIVPDSNGISMGWKSTKAYANGEIYDFRNSTSTWVLDSTESMYFETLYSLPTTETVFTDTDPSTILTDIMTTYNADGGSVQMPGGGYVATGVLSTYTFKLSTVLEGIQQVQTLGPQTNYYYVDPGTNTLIYKAASATADIMLIKGRHLSSVAIEATKENIVNDVYFSGGDDGSGLGTTILVEVTDEASITKNRRGLVRISDNRVNSTTGGVATATQLAQSEIDANDAETYITNVIVLDNTMDVSLFKLGMMIGFSGFGNFIDNLLIQVVGIAYTPDYVTLSLGTLPRRPSQAIEKLNSALTDLQTVANANTPS